MPLPVVQPCPLGFCTPAGGGYFLTGGLSQPFSPWVSPAFLNFARRLGGCFLSGGLSQPFSSWGSALPSDFARRLGRSTSSPADILSPSPRGAALPSQVLHAGWRGCFLSGGHSQPFSSWGLALPSGFARRLGGYFLSGGHSQPLSP